MSTPHDVTFDAFINQDNIVVSYPELIVIKPVFRTKIKPLSLFTNELVAGDIIVLEKNKNDKIIRVYQIHNNVLFQIFGDPVFFKRPKVTLNVQYYQKLMHIKKYITNIFDILPINDLIEFKNDLNMFEKELTKFLLMSISKEKVTYKRLRSIVFKSCKNQHISEKICLLCKNNHFDHFDNDYSEIIIDFDY